MAFSAFPSAPSPSRPSMVWGGTQFGFCRTEKVALSELSEDKYYYVVCVIRFTIFILSRLVLSICVRRFIFCSRFAVWSVYFYLALALFRRFTFWLVLGCSFCAALFVSRSPIPVFNIRLFLSMVFVSIYPGDFP